MATFLYYVSRRPKVLWRPKHLGPAPAQPTGFVGSARRPRVRIRHGKITQATLARRKQYPLPIVAPVSVISWKKPPRAKVKRGRWNVLKIARRRYPIAPAPVSVLSYKKPPRPKIRRRKINVLTLARRRYPIAPKPVGFVAYRPFPRPKIKRRKSNVKRFFNRRYPTYIPVNNGIVSTLVINKPIDYFLAGDKDKFRKGFAPWKAMKNIFKE